MPPVAKPRLTTLVKMRLIALDVRWNLKRAYLRAHYDGEHIVLDEPFEIPANAPLAVTVLAPDAPGT